MRSVSFRTYFALYLPFISVVAAGCVVAEHPEQLEIETSGGGLTKAQDPNANGDFNFCSDPTATCDEGEGDCDGNAECTAPLECGRNNGPFFSQAVGNDVCVVAHCNNGIRDADETSVDCGGMDCGSNCNAVCGSQPPNGQAFHCTGRCPCPAGEGDCNGDQACEIGLVCGRNNGRNFGFTPDSDVCVVSSCDNGVFDTGEDAVDCGGVCGTSCAHLCPSDPVGSNGHCNATCPCPALEGDCDSDAECRPGLECVAGAGTALGFGPGVDACLSTTCSSGTQNGDETGVDCGGSCLPCAASFAFRISEGLADEDLPYSVAIDAQGNVAIAGKFSGTANFGGSNLTVNGANPAKTDIFVALYDSQGNHIFSDSFGGPADDGNRHVDVTFSDFGDVIVVGNWSQTVDFGDGSGPQTTSGRNDVFIASYSPTGTINWVNTFGGSDDDLALAVESIVGSVFVAGGFEGTTDFGGSTRTSNGNFDAFIAQFLLSDGSFIRATSWGSTGDDRIYGMDLDSSRNVYAAGVFTSTVGFGSLGNRFGDDGDAFAIRLSRTLRPNGWVQTFGGASKDVAYDIAVDDIGNAVMTGIFARSVQVGTSSITSEGVYDGFVVSLDSATGTVNWSDSIGGPDQDEARSVAVIPSTGRIAVVGGSFAAPTRFPLLTPSFGGTVDGFVVLYNSVGTAEDAFFNGGSGPDRYRAVDGSSQGFGIAGEFSGTVTTMLGNSFTASGDRDAIIGRLNP